MPDLTLKLPVDSADELMGGILPMNAPQPTAPLLPMSPPGGTPPMLPPMTGAPQPATGAPPDISSGPLPPIPQTSTMGSPAGPPGSADYFANKYSADLAKPQPGLLGKIGGTALSVLTPGIAAMIPSTPLGRIAQQNRDLSQLQTAQGQEREAQTAASEAGLRGAQTEHEQAATAALENPEPKATKEPAGTAEEQGYQEAKQANPQLTRTAFHAQWEAAGKPAAGAGTAEEQGYQEAKQANPQLTRTAFHAQWEAAGKPAAGDAKNDARLDRSYQFNSTQLEKERAPVEAQMGKIGAALSNLNLQSPQADALLAPQILSIAAGGTGSGLRMNEAEISRIVGGSTKWTQLQTALNKWSTDPTHATFTPAQRKQMSDILGGAQAKGTQKQQILEWSENALIDADDPTAHRQTVAQTRKLLDAVDQGKTIERNKKTGELRIAAEPTK